MDRVIAKILEETNHSHNPYFDCLRDGSFSKEDFIETQIQFYYAVIFFSRPMAALAARIPTYDLRLEILRNIWEEHGEGDTRKVHGETFLTLLQRLGKITEADIDQRALWPEVRLFNTTLVGACVLDEYLIGAAVMGMIERMFCEISNWIGHGIVSRGWLKADQMIHYNLHEKIDIKHSQDFFDILKPAWNRTSEDRYYIDQGLRLGATLFNGLYDGLYRSRQRRLLREISGPHSRAAQ